MMDVEILAVALQRFRELYARLCGVEPASIELPLTTASAAYRIWCSMSWPEQWTYTNKKGKLRKHASVDVAFNNAFRESQAGGMVRLKAFGKKVRWEINWPPIKNSGLRLSAQLLRSATRVVEAPR